MDKQSRNFENLLFTSWTNILRKGERNFRVGSGAQTTFREFTKHYLFIYHGVRYDDKGSSWSFKAIYLAATSELLVGIFVRSYSSLSTAIVYFSMWTFCVRSWWFGEVLCCLRVQSLIQNDDVGWTNKARKKNSAKIWLLSPIRAREATSNKLKWGKYV